MYGLFGGWHVPFCPLYCNIFTTASCFRMLGVGVWGLLLGITLSVHTNNWVVIVDASRYWFNYRHVANALSIYYSVKRLGLNTQHLLFC